MPKTFDDLFKYHAVKFAKEFYEKHAQIEYPKRYYEDFYDDWYNENYVIDIGYDNNYSS